MILALLEMGVVAWLPKTASLAEIENCLIEIIQKGFFYHETVLEVVREHMSKQPSKRLPKAETALSKREKVILQLICEQCTNTEIGKQLNISNRTVEWHRTNLLRKLHVRNTAGLVAVAIIRNLVQLDLSRFQ